MGVGQRWLAVRCCCTPKKIFGFMRIADISIKRGYIKLVTRSNVPCNIRLEDMMHAEPCKLATPEQLKKEPFAFSEPIKYELAIYSEERPIEFWRQFDEFVEVSS